MEFMQLDRITKTIEGSIVITGSKSESNRLLILNKLYPSLQIENLSNSEDTQVLENALNSDSITVDIGHAGTAMRFLTAYYASQEHGEITLTGSKRMKERPIGLLVDALNELGASVEYLEKEGYPPLKIRGGIMHKNTVSIRGDVSSQYITALLLVAPTLPNGLTISFSSALTSVPYVDMTLEIMYNLGIQFDRKLNEIRVYPTSRIDEKTLVVESDWSSASYFYSLVALSPGAVLYLRSFRKDSLQGDASIATIYESLGVKTIYEKDGITLTNTGTSAVSEHLALDLRNSPDIAQTIAVTCFGLGLSCNLTGLHTLKIKETDRLSALKTELERLGAIVQITDESLALTGSGKIQENVCIDTYDDHRMAMAFAPLAALVAIQIQSPEVVGKSYPDYWSDFKRVAY
jgi:3-phosphoshikimate 1-carboxyvinyltransferase